jgi:L-asparagine transporter-like permease
VVLRSPCSISGLVETLAEGKSQMIAHLAKILYWCCLAITLMCEIAAITILTALFTNKLPGHSDAWMAVVFFAVFGVFAWIVGRVARPSSG